MSKTSPTPGHDEHVSLSAKVEHSLKERILNGDWEEGFKLPSEGKLCTEFGVSRTAVREAMRQLRGQGLIETINGSGSYVSGGRLENVAQAMVAYSRLAGTRDASQDLVDFRIVIEGEAASRLAEQDDRSALASKMWEAYHEMESADNGLDFANADIRFHLSLLETCGNAFINMMGQALNAHYERFIRLAHSADDPTTRNMTLDEHKRILDAIESGDSTMARDTIGAHLGSAASRLRKIDE
ncbi:FadR/GntR family transcriptional regulator [Sulfuriroseicoccus oceanibius]|uniref:FadR family transcriptional regulator n=1 Tax=Sulfuriroseicoccus oceanibius TaxID=2707525 RepID=A0A6B3L459_9BACT|nr:FadR/GntR family transcriptional regulator [Sulfuriroseicoccus oceanibius]QQL44575.1 FadR family transcriptional regulator [Sulfuriroseicoccus oceanibius]